MAKNYPESWKVIKLGSFVISEKGKKPKHQQTKQNKDFCHPYIDIEAFEKKIIKSYTNGKGCVFCSEDDFLMVWDGSRSGYVGKGINGALGSTLVRINFPQINNNYAYYFLQSKFLEINTKARGSGTPHVNPELLWNYDFPIPPIEEQHRIVAKIEELFSKLDKGIESLKAAQTQLKNYRQSLLKEAFAGKLTATWRAQQADKLEAPEQLLARIQQEREARYQQQLADWQQAVKEWEQKGKEGKKPSCPKEKQFLEVNKELIELLPTLPTNYKYIFLDQLGELARGKSKHRPRNDPKLFGGEYPFIQTGEVKAANRVITTYTQTLNKVGLAQSKLWPKGTLCITIAANIAETAFLGFDGCFPDSIVGYTAYNNIVDPRYIELFIKAAKEKISAYAPATAQKNINLTTLENLVIPYTTLDEQLAIINQVDKQFSVIDNNLEIINSCLTKSQSLRQSILKKAFAGELVPQDPTDEPASELLKRIAQEKAQLAQLAQAQAKARKTKKGNKKP